jgi:hypothetical protein
MERDIEILRRLIAYDPRTGSMTWLKASPDMFDLGKRHSPETRCAIWNAKYSGKPALIYREKARPYAYGDILGKKAYAHRVAAALMTGCWPDTVDHIDGDKSNNAWANLRCVSVSENMKNTPLRSDNNSGHPGVYWDKSRGKWAAEGISDGKKTYLGRHATLEAARAARRNFELTHGYGPQHGAAR